MSQISESPDVSSIQRHVRTPLKAYQISCSCAKSCMQWTAHAPGFGKNPSLRLRLHDPGRRSSRLHPMSSSLSSKSYQRHIIGLAQPRICCRKLSYSAKAITGLSSSTPHKRVWVVLYPMQGLYWPVQSSVQSSCTPMIGSVSTVVPFSRAS